MNTNLYRFKNIENETVEFKILKQHYFDFKKEGKSKIEERIVKKYIDDGFVQLKEKDDSKWIDINKDDKSKIKIIIEFLKQDLHSVHQNKALNEYLDKFKKELTSLITSIINQEFKLIREGAGANLLNSDISVEKEKSIEKEIKKEIEKEIENEMSVKEIEKSIEIEMSVNEELKPKKKSKKVKEESEEKKVSKKPKKAKEQSEGSEEALKPKKEKVSKKSKVKVSKPKGNEDSEDELAKKFKKVKISKSKNVEKPKEINSIEEYLNKNSSDEDEFNIDVDADPKEFVRFMEF